MVVIYYTWHKTRRLREKRFKNRQTNAKVKPVVNEKYVTHDYFGDGEHDAITIARYEKFANDGDS